MTTDPDRERKVETAAISLYYFLRGEHGSNWERTPPVRQNYYRQIADHVFASVNE